MSLEDNILAHIDKVGSVEDSLDLSAVVNSDHKAIVGVLKSLSTAFMIVLTQKDQVVYTLTASAEEAIENGSPESKVWKLLPATQKDLDAKLGKDVSKLGTGKLGKLVKFNKGEGGVTVEPIPDAVFVDETQETLKKMKALPSMDEKAVTEIVPKAELDTLKKRKFIGSGKLVSYSVVKGPKFALQRVREATDLTAEMIQSGKWSETPFKAYNFNTLGKPLEGGHLHPLMKLRQEYRELFLELGFQEMQTNKWVESSFWCFDTLFVPQQHPARDMQDTFFISDPAATTAHPPKYEEAVVKVHETGDYGGESSMDRSIGYNCPFSVPETQKNVLRTHTTACSSRTLYNLAQISKESGLKPGKYFSIDRVFRNEEMDKTHLCEFHQIEGFVIDRNLSLANMMQVLEEFFMKVGVKKLRFKPAYNPYTEPSMEVFGYHEGLKKWIEVGNSGMFRPEMLRPMGFPEDVNAIAWGLSLERPAMMKYGLNNIHKLFGHGVDLNFIKTNPICQVQA